MKKLIFCLVSIALAASIMLSASYSVLFAYALRDGIAVLTSPVLKLTAPADKYLEENPYRVKNTVSLSTSDKNFSSAFKGLGGSVELSRDGENIKIVTGSGSTDKKIILHEGYIYLYKYTSREGKKMLKAMPTKEQLKELDIGSTGSYNFDLRDFGDVMITEEDGKKVIRFSKLDKNALKKLRKSILGDVEGFKVDITDFSLTTVLDSGKYEKMTLEFNFKFTGDNGYHFTAKYKSITKYEYDDVVVKDPDPNNDSYKTVSFDELMEELED